MCGVWNKSPITSGCLSPLTLYFVISRRLFKWSEIHIIILAMLIFSERKGHSTVKRRIRMERAWKEFINQLASFIPQNLLAVLAREDNMFIKEKSQGDHQNPIEQNTVTSSPRSTGTFCYVIHGLSHVPKRPPPSLVKDSVMDSKACVPLQVFYPGFWNLVYFKDSFYHYKLTLV